MNKGSELKGGHAVVIGGSIAGLLAARVLRDFFERVTLIERDSLPIGAEQRRGVPHGWHAHALLAGGQKVLEELFPGISEELIGAGSVPADPLHDGTWFFEGSPLLKTSSGTSGILTSRPFLESAVRRRVRSLDGIDIVDGRTVRGLVASEKKRSVTGVQTEDEDIEADLVVDATGRGSRSPQWLHALGFPAPREEKVEVQLAYTTRLFRRRPDHLDGDKFSVIAPTPTGKRGGVIGIQEGERWIVTLFGHFGHVAPQDLTGYTEFAKSLPAPFIYNVIRDAEPIGDACTFRFPASSRRRYEALDRFPEGFLVFGDAICSFNPIYGQGMSSAALQASALRAELKSGTGNLARRFFRKAAQVIDNPWNIAVGGDLKIPETIGPRGPVVKLINWYMSKVHKCAHNDAVVSRAFMRVAQLLDAPGTLMTPGMLWRVFTAKAPNRRRFSPSVAANEIVSS
jgi:2-polyprenyl-6-methoxyphenol hydroxylase-like FAD-dependent oxidoreductase